MSGELAFVEALRRLAVHPGARDFADDCAVIEVGNETIVLTHDAMLEGVHYLPDQDRADVAWKLVSVNMSDLAAKGARPLGVLLGYMLGREDARFVEGLEEALAFYDVPLLGGDTVAGEGPQALGLTALGRATFCPVPSRAGARVGDGLWITGPVGAAMIGFEALRTGTGNSMAYRRPVALLKQGEALAPQVTAMMDVSDGLLLDAKRMADASGVTLAIDSAAVPVACPPDRRAQALRWGDDYQLLFTLPRDVEPMAAATRIGEARTCGPASVLVDEESPDPADLGWEH